MRDAEVFGVVMGTVAQPRVAYLARSVPVSLVAERVSGSDATRVLRHAAACEESSCVHFNGMTCALGARIANDLEAVVTVLPRCGIRSGCRWFAEQGGDVRLRCPQVVTLDGARPGVATLRAVASPRVGGGGVGSERQGPEPSGRQGAGRP
jgi:hypothetical protein